MRVAVLRGRRRQGTVAAVPRKPRIVVRHGIYHVTSRGNRRQAIQVDAHDGLRFEKLLATAVERYELILHAWCLLSNHLHLVVEVPEGNLSRAMQWLKATYAQRFNWRHDVADHLFGGRFFSKLLASDESFLNACEYVLANPAEAGVVALPESYRWSSCAATLGLGAPQPYLTTTRVLATLDPDPERAREILRRRLHRRLEGAAARAPADDWLFRARPLRAGPGV
jgi:putative transposase